MIAGVDVKAVVGHFLTVKYGRLCCFQIHYCAIIIFLHISLQRTAIAG